MPLSILVINDEIAAEFWNVLADTGPEMRLQILWAEIERIESVLVTRNHADHIFGTYDIRQFNFVNDRIS